MRLMLMFTFTATAAACGWVCCCGTAPLFPFLRGVSYPGLLEFNSILNNATLTRAQMERTLEQWADKYNVRASFDSFVKQTSEIRQKMQDDIANALLGLQTFFEELAKIQNDKTLTIQQARAQVRQLFGTLRPQASQVAACILCAFSPQPQCVGYGGYGVGSGAYGAGYGGYTTGYGGYGRGYSGWNSYYGGFGNMGGYRSTGGFFRSPPAPGKQSSAMPSSGKSLLTVESTGIGYPWYTGTYQVGLNSVGQYGGQSPGGFGWFFGKK